MTALPLLENVLFTVFPNLVLVYTESRCFPRFPPLLYTLISPVMAEVTVESLTLNKLARFRPWVIDSSIALSICSFSGIIVSGSSDELSTTLGIVLPDTGCCSFSVRTENYL